MEKENIIITTKKPIQANTVIEIWCVHLSEYLICATKLCHNRIKMHNILFQGIQTMLHVFSILYYKINDVEEYYNQTQRAYLLYLEYIEHVYLKNNMGISPSLFVYNRIFENVNCLDKSHHENGTLFIQIAYWTNFILLRNILEISFSERHQLMEEFLHGILQKQINNDDNNKGMELNHGPNIQLWRQTFSDILHS